MKKENQLTHLDGQQIYQAFLSGAYEIIDHREVLNRINVFPIADGDTGSNLSFTMQSIIDNAQPSSLPKESLQSIADAALMGARGNSGIIFAQLINGIYMAINEESTISLSSFIQAIQSAKQYAYQAISQPVEGTIITVISDWADALLSMDPTSLTFEELLEQSIIAATVSLNETTSKLKALQDANVVDSGAQGLLYFIQGMLSYIKTGHVHLPDNSTNDINTLPFPVSAHEDFDENYRYCVEGILQGTSLDKQQIKSAIQSLGNSLIIIGHTQKIRIHIHTNHPEKLFDIPKTFGTIIFQKADDMKRQYESIHRRKHPIALLTDSIADIPKELMDQYQIHLLPLNLIIEQTNYLDKVTISPQYFYQLMDELTDYPSSSQPTVKEAEKVLTELAEHYPSIIAITVSSQMSGTYETLVKANKQGKLAQHQIEIIDSKQNSGAQGLVVKAAAEAIDAGYTFEEVVKRVKESIKKTKIFVSVPTLKYMLKSGRIGKAQAFAADVVNLKPVVSIDQDGNGIVIGKTFSINGNTKKIQSLVKSMMQEGQIKEYAIVHANGGDRVQAFETFYTQLIGQAPAYIMEISPIVAMSAGLGTVAIALITE
ncbi:DAK2 domain-containing protein [Atopobacter phocae]|uniref:DAK2 domain-containing protein n=1 Tax=Atopobacter phocae TaxID=136492 RepID=UPI0004B1809D|nr:DegV family protein [Atopobacter phocae]